MIEPITFNGLKVIPDMHISDYRVVRRTWKERLFSRPWQPLLKAKTIHDPVMFRITLGGADDIYLCSYETYAKLVKEVEIQNGKAH